MLKKLLPFLALTSLIVSPTAAIADPTLIHSKTFYPDFCRIKIDDWQADCEFVIMGILSDYSAFNIKLCTTSGKYYCLILIGEADELKNYPSPIYVSTIAWQEGTTIKKKWSSSLAFGPYRDGMGIVGTVEGSVIVGYFE
jgi:hypothetical protein